MKFPNTVPESTKNTYALSELAKSRLCGERKTIADVFETDLIISDRVNSLKEICLKSISKYFHILSPIPRLLKQDFKYLIDILPTDLHIKYTIDIPDELYWKRCSEDKWEKTIFPGRNEDFWKKYFLSGYLQSCIEETQTRDIEDLIDISKLTSVYVTNLTITKLAINEEDEIMNEMKKVKFDGEISERSFDRNQNFKYEPELPSNHTALDKVLGNLTNLIELHLKFSLDNNFEMLFKSSILDCQLICKGLSSNCNLKILKIHRWFIDVDRARIFSKFIMNQSNIVEIDFSNCMMTDDSLKAILYVLMNHRYLKKMVLRNNDFRDDGIQSLAYAIANKSEGCIEELDISMNMLNSKSSSYMASALIRCKENIKRLIVSCCGIKNEGAIKIAGSLQYNRSLSFIDLSGNDFSGDAANILLESMRSNPTMQNIDIKYSGISAEILEEINDLLRINRHRSEPIEELYIPPLYLNEPEYFVWEYDPNNPEYESGCYPERVPVL